MNSTQITVTKGGKFNQRIIYSKHSIFKNEYLKVFCDENILRISVPDINYSGKMHKTSKNNFSELIRVISITSEFLNTGKYEISEDDSTEDEIVIYLK